VTPRTNLWLRQDFELAQIPAGKVVFRLNRNHDGQVLLNGVPTAPTADWADAESLHTCSAAAQATLISGRNVLAIHCQDADDGCPIGVTLFEAQDPNCGWTALIEEFSQMSSRMPQRSDLYAGRAYALLKSGRHKEAIQDLNKALELKPTDQASSCLLLSLLAVTGAREAYTQKRHEVLVQFARLSDPDAMERLARASLLMAGQDADSEVAIQMAHRAAKAGYCNGNLIARQLTESLAQFRAAQFSEAIQWARKATATGSVAAQPGWSHLRMRTLGCATTLLEAMSRQRLGQAAEASASLAMGMDLAKTEFLLPDESDPNSVWPDGLFIQALMREARLLIQGAPAAAEFETLKIRTQTGNP